MKDGCEMRDARCKSVMRHARCQSDLQESEQCGSPSIIVTVRPELRKHKLELLPPLLVLVIVGSLP